MYPYVRFALPWAACPSCTDMYRGAQVCPDMGHRYGYVPALEGSVRVCTVARGLSGYVPRRRPLDLTFVYSTWRAPPEGFAVMKDVSPVPRSPVTCPGGRQVCGARCAALHGPGVLRVPCPRLGAQGGFGGCFLPGSGQTGPSSMLRGVGGGVPWVGDLVSRFLLVRTVPAGRGGWG